MKLSTKKLEKMAAILRGIESKKANHVRLANLLRVAIATLSAREADATAADLLAAVEAKQSLESAVTNAQALVNHLKEANAFVAVPVAIETVKRGFWVDDRCLEWVAEGDVDFSESAWAEAKAAGFGR